MNQINLSFTTPKQNENIQYNGHYLSYSEYKMQMKKNKQQIMKESIKIKNIIQVNTPKKCIELSFIKTQYDDFKSLNLPIKKIYEQSEDPQQHKQNKQIFQKKILQVSQDVRRSQSQNIFLQSLKTKNQFQLYKVKNNRQNIQKTLSSDKDNEIPQITARSWAIFNSTTGKAIWLKDGHKKREMASLTKIMTAYISLQLIDKYEVSQRAQNLIGTTAELKYGDKIKVIDLLYALMLPSGNDAAYVLAENFGHIIKLQKKNQIHSIDQIRATLTMQNIKSDKNEDYFDIYDCSQYFINQMNQAAKYMVFLFKKILYKKFQKFDKIWIFKNWIVNKLNCFNIAYQVISYLQKQKKNCMYKYEMAQQTTQNNSVYQLIG